MGGCRIFNAKVLLGGSNLLLMGTSIGLLICGYYLLLDEHKILLSTLITTSMENNGPLSALPQPFFFYIALGITFAGIIVFISSTIGFWAVCSNSYCILVLFCVSLMATIWPQCLGLTLNNLTMVRSLQGLYGVSGEEFYSAALDLAQVQFKCCGIDGSGDYENSLWKTQGLAKKELVIPLTCCKIENDKDDFAHMDPKPTNSSLCESLTYQDYFKHRHSKGCLHDVEQWYRDHYVFFLTIIITMVCIEFLVILNIIYSCSRLQKMPRIRNDLLTGQKRGLEPVHDLHQIYNMPKKHVVRASGRRITEPQSTFINPTNKLSKNYSLHQMYKPNMDEFDSNCNQDTRSYLV